MKLLLFLPFLHFYFNAYSQNKNFIDRDLNNYQNVFTPKAGISYQNLIGAKAIGLEGGVLLGRKYNAENTKAQRLDDKKSYRMKGVSLTGQIFKSESGFLFGPKLTYDYYQDFLGLRVGTATYFSKGFTPDYRLIGEGGISFLGIANLFIGLSFPTNYSKINNLGMITTSFQINLDGAGIF